jgi:pimeloyl-ACP methyl ester carboxylesterase
MNRSATRRAPVLDERLLVHAPADAVTTVFPDHTQSRGIGDGARPILEQEPGLPIEQIAAPTLVVHGDADRIVPYENGVALALEQARDLAVTAQHRVATAAGLAAVAAPGGER